MAERSTWVKLDRSILEWEWYQDNNTKAVFLHLILKANIKDGRFMGVAVHRGQLVTSYPSLARDLGMSVRSVRTAIKHLKATGEVTGQAYHDFSLITVVNYDLYQDKVTGQVTGKRQANDRPATGKRQQSKNIRMEERKNIAPPAQESKDWEKNIPEQFVGRFESKEAWEAFWGGEE